MNKNWSFVIILLIALSCNNEDRDAGHWALIFSQPGEKEIEVIQLPRNVASRMTKHVDMDGFYIDVELSPGVSYTGFKASVVTEGDTVNGMLSLRYYYKKGKPFNFLGEVGSDEVFRQSPHDVNAWIVKDIAMQAVPVAGVLQDSVIVAAVSNAPFVYRNFSSQGFFPSRGYVEIASGDNGEAPGKKPDSLGHQKIDYNTDKTQIMSPGKIISGYHAISPGLPHVFDGFIFTSNSTSLNDFRGKVNSLCATYFSGGKVKDYFGALAFTTAYMNLRYNETGKSKVWVVPSVEYANTQYCRDAFWISTMLPPEYSAECLANELAEVNNYAEYPLMAVLWAYRAMKDHQPVNHEQVKKYVRAIEKRTRDGYFYSYLEKDGRLDFQYWGDLMAFERSDVIAYNQGLYALALQAANEMGITTMGSAVLAKRNYMKLFDNREGFLPISKFKKILGPDPVVPDLISQLLFHKPLLSREQVAKHFSKVVLNSKTKFGYKIVSNPDGTYLSSAMYDVSGYLSQVNREQLPDGRYFRGGSYFLYDNLFLIDAYLHNVSGAEEELMWRVGLDFSIGSTTYECLNTITGEPWKPNMGWNVAVYSIWRQLIEEGKATNKLFNHVDQIVEKNKR